MMLENLNLHPEVELDLVLISRTLWATALGAIIGWERECSGHPAGIRTFAFVTMGACVFGLVSRYAPGVVDATRIAAQVVAGIGFLCAGLILRIDGQVRGLTTAATLWMAAAIGLAVAFRLGLLATAVTLVSMLLLRVQHTKLYLFLIPNRTGRSHRLAPRKSEVRSPGDSLEGVVAMPRQPLRQDSVRSSLDADGPPERL